jgi:hypothetical protein
MRKYLLVAMPLLAVAGGLLLVQVLREAEEWDAFAERRQCKAVAYMVGDKSWPLDIESRSHLPVTPEGPGQRRTGYACNDGFTYWR